MLKYLFIAEKPSLMQDVKSCYENHKSEIQNQVGQIDFVALSGHVCTNGEPKDYSDWDCPWQDVDYPMVPTRWIVKPIKDKYKLDTIKKIKEMSPKYDCLIVGTDSDVEGYGIYYLLETYLGLQKKKAVRFVEHSLTDKEILHSLLHMTDYHTDPIHVRFTQSFLLRSQADWLFGMNCTRKMTLHTGELMTIGRVKAPTIKIVYDNSMSIENFKERKYYTINANYGSFIGTCVDENGKNIELDVPEQDFLKKIPKEGIIKNVSSKENVIHAPKLYDLPILQGEAGQTFGMTPSEVLETVQALYEKHKVISYPRTQCRFVSSEKAKEFPEMLQKMAVFPDLAPYLKLITKDSIVSVQKDKQVVNDTEVMKESHDALLPTNKTPILSEMTKKEIDICHLIYKRLLAQFLPKQVEMKTQIVTQHGNYTFLAQGKVIKEQGWRNLYNEAREKKLPDLIKGGKLSAENIGYAEKITKPPKRLTQATLLLAMENIANQIEDKELKKSLADSKGIGTPATRDQIIQDIIKRGYIEDKGKKGIYITDLGKKYVQLLEGIDIGSPVFAAKLDTEIKKIQRGEGLYKDTYTDMIQKLNMICQQIDSTKPVTNIQCPRCNANLQSSGYKYLCEKCNLEIPKMICGQKIDEAIIKELANNKKTKQMNFVKKDKTKFTARIKLTDEGLKFDTSLDIKCPFCNEGIQKGKYGYYCNCGFKIPLSISDNLTKKDLETLCKERKLDEKDGYKGKNGNTFSAKLKMEDKKVLYDFS